MASTGKLVQWFVESRHTVPSLKLSNTFTATESHLHGYVGSLCHWLTIESVIHVSPFNRHNVITSACAMNFYPIKMVKHGKVKRENKWLIALWDIETTWSLKAILCHRNFWYTFKYIVISVLYILWYSLYCMHFIYDVYFWRSL